MRGFPHIFVKKEQVQMYVNYHTRKIMNDGDISPVGIILCADKGDSIYYAGVLFLY